MKVLQANCVYKKGSTGKIVNDVHVELLNRGIESVVCYGRGEIIKEPHVYKTCGEFYSNVNHFLSYITGIMYGGCFFSTNKLIDIIKKEKPDVVHLQCINGYFVNIYRLINWLKANHIRVVLTLHAEFMYTGGCGHSIDCNQWSTHEGCGHSKHCPRWREETHSYFFDRTGTMWRRMEEAFEGFDNNLIVTSVSPWLMERAARSTILKGKKHYVVLNGLDTNIFCVNDMMNLRAQYSSNGEKIIFHATPSFNLDPNHIKGGYYINELAKCLKNSRVKVLVAGDYEEEIDVSDNIILLGKINDQSLLAQYYSMADLTVLASKKETFSMITAESLCCGTPIVGFKAGGLEQIAILEYSSFVDYGDVVALEREVNKWLSADIDKRKISKVAIAKFSKEKMASSYIDIYRELSTN